MNAKNISKYNKLRIANFCELEFADGGLYDLNNQNGFNEIIEDFNFNECEAEQILYNNDDIKEEDPFIYCSGRSAESITEKQMNDIVNQWIDHAQSNGELKELLEECLW